MKSIYIIHTPYHLLISCGLAASNHLKNNYLIIIGDFESCEIYYNFISSYAATVFSDILVLPGKFNLKRKDVFHKIVLLRQNSRKIKSYLKSTCKSEKCTTFIFNDERIEGQTIAYFNSKKNGTNIYVEDGFNCYSELLFPVTPAYKKLIYKTIFGYWYENIRYLGSSKFIDQVMVFRPNIIRKDLRKKDVVRISSDIFFNAAKSIPFKHLVQSSNSNLVLRYDCILILPPFQFIDSFDFQKFYSLYHSLLDILLDNFDKVSVKYHPREVKYDYLNLSGNHQIDFIENSLPLEIVWFLIIQNPPKLVIGDISTALLTCDMILKDTTKIISTIRMLNLPKKYASFLDVFCAIGIKTPNSMNEIREIFE